MRERSAVCLFTVCVLVITTLCTTSCKQTFSSPWKLRGLRVDGEIFHVKAFKLSDSTVQLSFVGTANLRTKEASIRYVDVAIGTSADALHDTVAFSVDHIESDGGGPTQAIGNAVWDSPTAKLSTSAVGDISVLTASDHLVFRQIIEYSEAEGLFLTPFATAASDTTIEIGALAKRIYLPPGEYLPSSENFRVIISEPKGAVVWRSDAGMSFLAMVGNVEPRQANQVQRYSLPWNGRDLQQNIVAPGDYVVEFIIPARPKPYQARTTLQWPPR
ncbi:MAG: BsuPI-related putative proteinase inhibitor [bacterium]|nr:BsuPI-related putative proteinase inhibitor [bacterium]